MNAFDRLVLFILLTFIAVGMVRAVHALHQIAAILHDISMEVAG